MQDFDKIIRDELSNFIKIQNIKKNDFASVYGCSDTYLSQMLSGYRNIDFSKFITTIQRIGFDISIDFGKGLPTFIYKKNPDHHYSDQGTQ